MLCRNTSYKNLATPLVSIRIEIELVSEFIPWLDIQCPPADGEVHTAAADDGEGRNVVGGVCLCHRLTTEGVHDVTPRELGRLL